MTDPQTATKKASKADLRRELEETHLRTSHRADAGNRSGALKLS